MEFPLYRSQSAFKQIVTQITLYVVVTFMNYSGRIWEQSNRDTGVDFEARGSKSEGRTHRACWSLSESISGRGALRFPETGKGSAHLKAQEKSRVSTGRGGRNEARATRKSEHVWDHSTYFSLSGGCRRVTGKDSVGLD